MGLSDYALGNIWSTTLPEGQRVYYESLLLSTLRNQSMFVPFCITKEDFRARDTGVITYTEVFDTSPNWNPIAENTIWLPGAHLDSRNISITLEGHGDTLKFSDYSEVVNYWNSGNFAGIVRGKLGQNMVDYLDILAMNAHLEAPNATFIGGGTDRFDLTESDVYDPDVGTIAKLYLEELNIPGVAVANSADQTAVLALTSPRVTHDMRKTVDQNGVSKWWDKMKYANPSLLLRGEEGSWDGVRYLRNNRLTLRNYGKVTTQAALAAPTVPGQGAAATYQGYSVGQSTSVRYVQLETGGAADFAPGMKVTIHSALDTTEDGSGGYAPNRSDGTQEERKIVSVDLAQDRLVFDRPLMKPHAAGDWVTKGLDLGATIVMGGPAVVYAVAERPHPIFPPKIDDRLMINRIGWRGFLKFQMFRPEYIHVIWSAVSAI